MKKKTTKLTTKQKYESLKRQTEQAGMTVKEENGKMVVARKIKHKLK